MKILGVQLRQPSISDLPVAALILGPTAALVAFCILVLGWDMGQASTIIYGSTAAAIANACGVDVREHGLRGLLVVVLIMVSLVVSTVGLHLMLI